MKTYEVSIKCETKEEFDQLAVILIHSGYNVYMGDYWDDKLTVCYSATDEDVKETKPNEK